MTLSLATCLLFLHLYNFAMGNVDSSPRMIFTEKGRKGKCFSSFMRYQMLKSSRGLGRDFYQRFKVCSEVNEYVLNDLVIVIQEKPSSLSFKRTVRIMQFHYSQRRTTCPC